jgi:hypothetical protein
MRIGGLVLIALGVLMTFTRVAAVILRFQSLSSHELSKAMGAIGFSFLILIAGVALLQRSRGKPAS